MRTDKLKIKRGAKGIFYEAVSPQHHPAVHTFQTVNRDREETLQQVQKKPEAGNFCTITRNFSVPPSSYRRTV